MVRRSSFLRSLPLAATLMATLAGCSSATSSDATATSRDPLDADPTCTSQQEWTGGVREDARMLPGEACIDCHTNGPERGPRMAIAGTVYPTGHEPDSCFGVDGSSMTDVKVVLTDATGQVFEVPVNTAGNFYLGGRRVTFTPPYTAKVISSAGEREMYTEQENGDCNACHSQTGAEGAPGRITLPAP